VDYLKGLCVPVFMIIELDFDVTPRHWILDDIKVIWYLFLANWELEIFVTVVSNAMRCELNFKVQSKHLRTP